MRTFKIWVIAALALGLAGCDQSTPFDQYWAKKHAAEDAAQAAAEAVGDAGMACESTNGTWINKVCVPEPPYTKAGLIAQAKSALCNSHFELLPALYAKLADHGVSEAEMDGIYIRYTEDQVEAGRSAREICYKAELWATEYEVKIMKEGK